MVSVPFCRFGVDQNGAGAINISMVTIPVSRSSVVPAGYDKTGHPRNLEMVFPIIVAGCGRLEFQDTELEVAAIYKAYVRRYKVWPYLVHYLYFRILKLSLMWKVTHQPETMVSWRMYRNFGTIWGVFNTRQKGLFLDHLRPPHQFPYVKTNFGWCRQ